MKLKLTEFRAVGGFYRYGANMCIFNQHDLATLSQAIVAEVGRMSGVLSIVRVVEEIVSRHSGGFKLTAGEVIMRDDLIVVRALDDSWQAGLSTSLVNYEKWMKDESPGTHAIFLRELTKQIEQVTTGKLKS